MKKKISLLLAFLMAASMMAGCKKTEEDTSGAEVTSSLTQMTMASEETSAEEETTETEETSVTEDTSETEEETSETEEETSASEETTAEETTTVAETTTAQTTQQITTVSTVTAAVTAASKSWNETEISETLYITEDCYSRTHAIVGSEAVKKYTKGTKINIVAATDTGYYKLADGTFIHSDYVSDVDPNAKTTTTKKKTETTVSGDEYEEIFADDPPQTTKKQNDPDDDKTTASNPISTSYNKSYTDRYPYKQLNSSEKELYRNIVEAAANFNTTVTVPDGLLSEDIFKVYAIVFNNEPQLFWLSTTVPSGYGTIELKFDITRSQAEQAQKTIDANTKDIMKKVSAYSSTVSKLKVIHDWIITHNTFDRQSNYATCGIYNGLNGNGVLQCNGYAKTVLYLCDMAGIDCMTVSGKNPEGDTHAWNVVYCDNGYYILDATWDDPTNSYGKSDFVRYVYFLANDSMTKNSHLSVSTMTRGNDSVVKLYDPPACTKTACYYFKAYNKEYSDLDSATEGLYAEFDDVIAAGKQVVHIRVTDHDTWEALTSTDSWRTFQNYAKSKSSKVSEIKRQRTLVENVLVVEYDIVYK